MRTTILSAVFALAAGAMPVSAADEGEVQVSVLLGAQNLQIDDETLLAGNTHEDDGVLVGAAVAYRLPSGLLFEGSILHGAYSSIFFANIFEQTFDNYQYGAAVGWQFDVNRWRLTPKVGVARSKLTSDAPLVFPPDGEVTDKVYATVPFVEASFVHRAWEHWAFGLNLRETFEDFGHTRSYSGTVQYFFD